MLHKTRGIVFRFTKYGDSSIIVNIFTELFGLQSYIVNAVRSKTSRTKIALFQPLTLLDMVVYYKENVQIKRIKEVKCLYNYQYIHQDIKKSALSMFLAEVLNRTVKDESHAQETCTFLINGLITLDTLPGRTENFHLIFLLKLSRYLGFGAHHVSDVLGPRVGGDVVEQHLAQLLEMDYEDNIVMTNAERREVLELILSFYRDHIESLGEIQSVQVLKEILS